MLYELEQFDWQLVSGFVTPKAEDRIILLHQHRLLSTQAQHWQPPRGDDERLPASLNCFQIAHWQGKRWLVASLDAPIKGMTVMDMMQVRELPEAAFALVSRALMVQRWLDNHRFCGRCGGHTRIPDQTELYAWCDACELRFYPSISPCVIVLVHHQGRVLLAQGKRHRPGYYSLLAGFMEAGESAEQAIKREIKEEVGIEVGNFEYLNSQVWPFPHQLMLGYFAEYQGGDLILEPNEILDAQWFDIDHLPKTSPANVISGWLLREFIKRQKALVNA